MKRNVDDLISKINYEKQKAIENGIIRKEKPQSEIKEKDIYYTLPNTWRWVRLGDYCLKTTDYVASGSFASIKKNVNYYNIENYALMVKTADFANNFTKNLTYTDESSYKFLSNSNLFGGELILSNIGSIGKVFKVPYLNRPMTLAPNTIMVKFTNDELADYIYYYFKSPYGQKALKSISSGTSMLKFNKTQLKTLPLPIPSLDIQKRIVAILNKSQDLIDKKKEQIKLLDDLAKSRFIEMFGDPINNHMKWEVKKLKDISIKILSGNTPKGGSQVYVDEGILFLRSQNVWKNRLELDDVVYIDQVTHNKMSNSSLKNRDILITKTGRINTENSSLGRAAMYLGEDNSANINGHVYLIRLKDDIINEFVLFILTMNEYREYIRSVCVGGIDKRQINKEHLEEFPIIFPPQQLQNKFIDFVKRVDKLKFEMEKSLEQMENNFNSLMQKAFKGELF